MAKKPKQTDLENLPRTAAEFIKLVIKKMRYRKKVRAEVMAELAAHFEDGLKDCKTDEERQHRSKKLIAEFGDVKLLGVLLRRAKKRCRPLWRTVTARTFQAVGVLILCFILYVAWFLTGKPRITTDYIAELNRLVRPVADESLNAAPLYHKAAELYGKPSDEFLRFFAENHEQIRDRDKDFDLDRRLAGQIGRLFSRDQPAGFNERRQKIQEAVANRLFKLSSNRYRQSSTAEKRFVERWIEDQKEALDSLVAGTRKPYYWQRYDEGGGVEGMMGILMPNLAKFRRLAFALCWRGPLSAEQGRYKDAFGDIKSCYCLGQHAKGGGILIEQLVGIALEALAVGRLSDILAKYEIDSVTLAAIQKDFEQMIAGEDFRVSFEIEKLLAYDAIQSCFSEDRFGGGHLCLDGLKIMASLKGEDMLYVVLVEHGWTAPLHILFTHPNKGQTREMVDRLYDFWNDTAGKTPAQIRADRIDLDERFMEIVKGNLLLEISAPGLHRVNELAHRNKIQTEALVPIIASLRYKKDKGVYPEDLDSLVGAGYLKALPIDPYSDRPLVYKRMDGSFTLYSFGIDFDDDGGLRSNWGRGDEGGDQVFWPVETPEEQELRFQREREKRRKRQVREMDILRKGKRK